MSKKRDTASPHGFIELILGNAGVVGLLQSLVSEERYAKVFGHSQAVIQYHEARIYLLLIPGNNRNKMIRISLIFFTFVSVQIELAYNFPYENVQLTRWDVGNKSNLVFGGLPQKDSTGYKNNSGYNGWLPAT